MKSKINRPLTDRVRDKRKCMEYGRVWANRQSYPRLKRFLDSHNSIVMKRGLNVLKEHSPSTFYRYVFARERYVRHTLLTKGTFSFTESVLYFSRLFDLVEKYDFGASLTRQDGSIIYMCPTSWGYHEGHIFIGHWRFQPDNPQHPLVQIKKAA